MKKISLFVAVFLLIVIILPADSSFAIQGSQYQTALGEMTKEQLMQKIGDCLQMSLQEGTMTKEQCLELKGYIEQIMLQYKLQNSSDERLQIMNMLKNALQAFKNYNMNSEAEELIKDMISIEPVVREYYLQLGSMYKNRADSSPMIFYKGQELKPDVPAMIKEGRALVPVRAVAEALGATIQWNEQEKTVLISKGDINIMLRVNNRIALVNGIEVELDSSAQITSSRVFVPLRFIMQTMKAAVEWFPEGHVIAMN